MTPVELSRTVLHAVRRAVDEGELAVAVLPERVVVAPPGPGGCGDYATSVALQLARPAGQPAPAVAELLRTRLLRTDGISDVVVTGPGFLNISLDGDADGRLVRDILRAGPRYGHSDTLAGQTVELHAAHDARAVVLMDAVARVLRSQGARPRLTCAGPPEDAWVRILGVPSDIPAGTGTGTGTDAPLRPVPAPADPTPLGRDAARWALLHPAPHDRPHIGDSQSEQHLAQRETNPLFRVRYAHARTRALLRNAADLGFTPEPGPLAPDGDGPLTFDGDGPLTSEGDGPLTPEPGPLTPEGDGPLTPEGDGPLTPEGDGPLTVDGEAQGLIQFLADHPRVLAATAAHRAPDRLARHLVAVADALAPLLPSVLPLGDEKPSAAHRARLALAEAAGTVLAGGLSLLGIDAPEHL
ncbi:DALR anticodon-binding domain-containing protein [Streptomyces griseoincarnatus]|uniref:arginine--tRNA ligase n=1 Tax=Streptomyces griseoincarnatus TaxID=29305 RepID=A0ABT0VR71_STRGI|nr:DALR anticodon-binding domain-containing protein [Streptomyces griseoincarnatus]MCM2513455.1 DALR anticodon-binding domain-containing protein [Streptomyces griseoincarnatus]